MYRKLGALALALAATPSMATTVVDPTGDFRAGYTGPLTANLDLISASATIVGSNLLLSATAAGAIGTEGSLYVFGIDRGAGTVRLPIAPTVRFDAVAVLFANGNGRIALLGAGPPTITDYPGLLTIDGNTISGLFPLAALPSTGAGIGSYTFSLWSRQRVVPTVDGLLGEIADFAPDSGTFLASVPEPATWGMMILGFGASGAAVRRRRQWGLA